MQNTPKGLRLHIGIFGRANTGKSSLLNLLTGQKTSIVSEHPGTTTDPVEKPMELLPLGPVLFIDTAGIDDSGSLGELRIARTRQIIDRTDLALLITDNNIWEEFEKRMAEEFTRRRIPFIAVFNKADISDAGKIPQININGRSISPVKTSAADQSGITDLRQAIIAAAGDLSVLRPLVSDLVPPGKCAVLVTPIDKEAPRGRLILPQVQAIRDLLDHGSYCLVVQEKELKPALENLRTAPALVVTDSQAFSKVASDTPEKIPLTSFSILLARLQADLAVMTAGACAIKSLKPGDTVLIAEACTHHPITDDIGTVKIPRWLSQYTGVNLNFIYSRGHDFPEDLKKIRLVIHCGACMWNRRAMISRLARCREAGVPVTNYGLAIAFTLGIIERALGPFPEALAVYQSEKPSTK